MFYSKCVLRFQKPKSVEFQQKHKLLFDSLNWTSKQTRSRRCMRCSRARGGLEWWCSAWRGRPLTSPLRFFWVVDAGTSAGSRPLEVANWKTFCRFWGDGVKSGEWLGGWFGGCGVLHVIQVKSNRNPKKTNWYSILVELQLNFNWTSIDPLNPATIAWTKWKQLNVKLLT